MLAVTFTEFGDPDVLRVTQMPQPVARDGEVVVKVAASTVNPTDTLMRAGKQTGLMAGLTPPYIAGMEFAGHVNSVSEGSSALTVGQPVMGIVNPRRPGGGAHAQYVCVPAASLAPLAESVDLADAATVPMNGLTALMVMEALELKPNAAVLVTGAAGAVGGYVIQLAKHAGLTVVADAKDSDVSLVRRLGADEIAPRGDAMDAAVRRRFPDGVDGLVDTALLGDRANALVRDGGTAVSLRRANPITDPRLRPRYVAVGERMTDTMALVRLAELVRASILTPRVGLRLPMSQAAQAHRLVEQGGTRGRIVLILDERRQS